MREMPPMRQVILLPKKKFFPGRCDRCPDQQPQWTSSITGPPPPPPSLFLQWFPNFVSFSQLLFCLYVNDSLYLSLLLGPQATPTKSLSSVMLNIPSHPFPLAPISHSSNFSDSFFLSLSLYISHSSYSSSYSYSFPSLCSSFYLSLPSRFLVLFHLLLSLLLFPGPLSCDRAARRWWLSGRAAVRRPAHCLTCVASFPS